MQITQKDRERIAEAVAKAEGRTSGEIRCVYTPYTDIVGQSAPLAAMAVSFIVTPWFIAMVGPEALAVLFGAWSVGHLAAAEAASASTITAYALVQVATFAAGYGLASWRPIRRLFTPRKVRVQRAHAAALSQFDALGLTRTRDRTGVLLFVSDEDHHAEVLADDGIYARAPKAVWEEVVALLVDGVKRNAPGDGFVAAVERTGQILADSLPPGADDRNELPDALVEAPPRRRRSTPQQGPGQG